MIILFNLDKCTKMSIWNLLLFLRTSTGMSELKSKKKCKSSFQSIKLQNPHTISITQYVTIIRLTFLLLSVGLHCTKQISPSTLLKLIRKYLKAGKIQFKWGSASKLRWSEAFKAPKTSLKRKFPILGEYHFLHLWHHLSLLTQGHSHLSVKCLLVLTPGEACRGVGGEIHLLPKLQDGDVLGAVHFRVEVLSDDPRDIHHSLWLSVSAQKMVPDSDLIQDQSRMVREGFRNISSVN